MMGKTTDALLVRTEMLERELAACRLLLQEFVLRTDPKQYANRTDMDLIMRAKRLLGMGV